MKTLIKEYGKINYLKRTTIYLFLYSLIIFSAFWLAYEIRFIGDMRNTGESTHDYLYIQRPHALIWVIPLKLIFLGFSSHYRNVIRYFRIQDALQIIYSLTLASIILFLISTIHTFIKPAKIII
jgi:FlaA1/EpsC-like NDP-sugar epimerase